MTIACAVPAARDGILDVGDLQPHWLLEIENFFMIHKNLESEKETSAKGWKKAPEAGALLEKYRIRPRP